MPRKKAKPKAAPEPEVRRCVHCSSERVEDIDNKNYPFICRDCGRHAAEVA